MSTTVYTSALCTVPTKGILSLGLKLSVCDCVCMQLGQGWGSTKMMMRPWALMVHSEAHNLTIAVKQVLYDCLGV